MEKSEVQRLAYEIADYWAQVEIESHCLGSGPWWSVKKPSEAQTLEYQRLTGLDGPIVDEEGQSGIDRAARYLELRGKLKRAPDKPELVQFCE